MLATHAGRLSICCIPLMDEGACGQKDAPGEAKGILLEWLRQIAPEDFPLVCVSEPLSGDEAEFLFEGAFAALGENPEDGAVPLAVNKHTGKVEVRAPLY